MAWKGHTEVVFRKLCRAATVVGTLRRVDLANIFAWGLSSATRRCSNGCKGTIGDDDAFCFVVRIEVSMMFRLLEDVSSKLFPLRSDWFKVDAVSSSS